MNNSSVGPSLSGARDFGDGANALWSLYCKVAQTHDEAQFQGLANDMDGVLVFVRLYHCLQSRLEFSHVYFHRRACFQLFSLLSSSTVFRICNRILRNNQYTITSNRSRCSPKSHSKLHPSLHRFPYHLLPHHLTQHSTHALQTSG